MPKFCSQCGFSVSDSAAFCGGCGSPIVQTCQTCGQTLPKGHKLLTGAKGSATASPETKVKLKKSGIPRIPQPVYGRLYDEDEDCPNCGAKGQNYEVCNKCDEDNR